MITINSSVAGIIKGITPHSMSKIGLVIILILMAGRNYAQQDYFALIQADNNQPFYVRIEDKTFSSSAQGHLILSQLKEGAYTIMIGFPKKLFPDHQFSIKVNNKDLEFQLKDLGDKGWALFNQQTLELKTADERKDDLPKSHLQGVKKDDAFSRLMAGVVSDTAVMYNTYAMEAALKDTPPVPRVAATDSAGLQGATPAGAVATSGNVPPVNVGNPSSGTAGISSSGAAPAGTSPAGASPDSGISTSAAAAIQKFPISGVSPSNTSPASGKDTSMNTSSVAETRKETARPYYASSTKGTDTSRTAALPDTLTSAGKETSVPAPLNKPVSADSSLSGQTVYSNKVDSPAIDPTARKVDSTATQSTEAASGVVTDPASTSGNLPEKTAASAVSLPKAGTVVKLSERKTTKGMRLVYADRAKGRKTDTIVVIIPMDTATLLTGHPAEPNSAVTTTTGSDTPASTVVVADHPATSPTGAASQKPAPLFRPDTSQKKTPSRLQFVNSDCKNFATDYDLDKLRVKMLETTKEEDKIQVAHKVFKTKCFSTRQIRALSEIFTSDAQKFRFFETAYPFVSDEHFKELTDLLADPVYNSKFRTMTGQ